MIAQQAEAVFVELLIHTRSSVSRAALLSQRTLLSSDFLTATKPLSHATERFE